MTRSTRPFGLLILVSALCVFSSGAIAQGKVVPVDKSKYKTVDLGSEPTDLPPTKKRSNVNFSVDCKDAAGMTLRKGEPGYEACLSDNANKSRVNTREKALETNKPEIPNSP